MKTETKKRERKPSKANKKRNSIIVGSVVLGFAVIGVITAISLIVGLFAAIFDDSDKKAEYEKFISPVVMVDPVAFESVSNADEHSLLMSSMWNLLSNMGENTTYPEDEVGMMLIPASDLNVSAASLFGSEVKLSHQTFGDTSITFEYNEENSTYTVPPMGYSVQYRPRVDKIKTRGKKITLTVSYVNTNTTITNTEASSGTESQLDDGVDKVMYYILEKTGKGKYVIRSVADNEKGEFTSAPTQNISSDTVSSGISKTETESDSTKTETSSKK